MTDVMIGLSIFFMIINKISNSDNINPTIGAHIDQISFVA